MSAMFQGATEFNGYVLSCDTGGLTDMSTMLQGNLIFIVIFVVGIQLL